MSTQYVGEIRVVGFNFAPVDWSTCQGQLVAISENTTLFQLLGTIYGGDGINTFALPNFKGNVGIHQGTGLGLQTWVIGEIQGTPNVTLTTAQVPQHNHTATFGADVQFGYEVAKPTNLTYPGRLQTGTSYAAQTPNATLAPQAVSTQGGSQPHENTMPYLVMLPIIALFGVFPSQN